MPYEAPTEQIDFDAPIDDYFNVSVAGGDASVIGSTFEVTSGVLVPPNGFVLELKEEFTYRMENLTPSGYFEVGLVTGLGDFDEFAYLGYKCSDYPGAPCTEYDNPGFSTITGFYIASGNDPDYFEVWTNSGAETLRKFYIHFNYNYIRPAAFILSVRSNQFMSSTYEFWQDYVLTAASE